MAGEIAAALPPAPQGAPVGGATIDRMPWELASQFIQKYESGGGKNILQTVYSGAGINPSTGTHTAKSTASGPWQITDATWNTTAPSLGVDTSQYPTAMSAPVPVQERVAKRLYQTSGWSPWAPWNPTLAAAVRSYYNDPTTVKRFAPNSPTATQPPQQLAQSPIDSNLKQLLSQPAPPVSVETTQPPPAATAQRANPPLDLGAHVSPGDPNAAYKTALQKILSGASANPFSA